MNLRSALSLIIIISILASCTKISTTDIGSGLIPPVDNIHTFETNMDVHTFNLLSNDSTYPIRTDNVVVGRISNDPLFGKTTGIINLELKPTTYPYSFLGIQDSLKMDSIVLVLSYKGFWGDSLTNNTLKVYEISPTDTLNSTVLYNTKRKFAHEATVLGSTTVDVRAMLKDSLLPNKEPVDRNQIRIKLTNPSFNNRIFGADTATTLKTDSAFKSKFRGFAIVPDTAFAANQLLVVNLSDTNTKLAVYYSYRVTGATKRDTTVDYFRLTSTSGFSNNIIRNPSPTPAYVSTLAAGEDSVVYLETSPDAPYTRLKIPGLDTLSNNIIHKAELIITQIPGEPFDLQKTFTPPNLFLSAFSSDSTRKFMLPGGDVQYSLGGVSNLQDFGSFNFTRTVNGQQVKAYSFDLTHYVQAIATRKNKNYDLILWAPFADYVSASEIGNTYIPLGGTGTINTVAVGRVRVGGGSLSQNGANAAYRMRLRIIYTRI